MTLTQKKVNFLWSEACEKSSQELKDRLTLDPILTLPKIFFRFVVYCDTSRIGISCILMQHDLNLCQRRWLELLKDYDMSVLYHPRKVNVVADSFSRLLRGSVAHDEDDKKELVYDVHKLV
ncbi:hypothetical protein MTR67_001819 [Solanum verrucosum]|uniref:Reverse transcriptase/retrotransposon-derived protein RNase H-like domain-containing protein n=1 Tax=Solanum verrucosum TaxID=315347 RepID=A0AAF0PV03_SOLVR|nr:hypothetical protein MTR67_001819 [Solanum verrucosum]